MCITPASQCTAGVIFIHLITITIGLLTALSLEGCPEWLHHLHLAYEAQASLRAEIGDNAQVIANVAAELRERQKKLTTDVALLEYFIKNKKCRSTPAWPSSFASAPWMM